MGEEGGKGKDSCTPNNFGLSGYSRISKLSWFKLNGLSYTYHLDKSISKFRVVG